MGHIENNCFPCALAANPYFYLFFCFPNFCIWKIEIKLKGKRRVKKEKEEEKKGKNKIKKALADVMKRTQQWYRGY